MQQRARPALRVVDAAHARAAAWSRRQAGVDLAAVLKLPTVELP